VTEDRRAGTRARLRAVSTLGTLGAFMLGGAAACLPGEPGPRGAPTTAFALEEPIVGSVLVNSTDCVVDAICSLSLAFADTTVVVVYGSGERPTPRCPTPVDASDAAFGVEAGDLVRVEVRACDDGGLVLASLRAEG